MATKTFKVSLSLDNPRIIQSGINVRSFDKQSIKIAIELTKDSQVYQIPRGAKIKISLLKLARQEQKIILDVPFTSADSIDWIVPEHLDGYQGAVRVGVYLIVGTENIDVGYFNITSSVSDIDNAAEEFTESVLQGWAIEDLTALLPKFQAVLDETTGKDVISAPEIILARDGATTLGERLEADKQEVTAQLAQKANQDDVRLKVIKIELEDMSETTLGAMSGNATFNLLSIPQDGSVNPTKTDFLSNISTNLFDDTAVLLDYIINSNGTVTPTTYSTFVTDKIPCITGDRIYLSGDQNGNRVIYQISRAGLFDSNNVLIKYIAPFYGDYTIVDADVAYAILCGDKVILPNRMQVKINDSDLSYDPKRYGARNDIIIREDNLEGKSIPLEKLKINPVVKVNGFVPDAEGNVNVTATSKLYGKKCVCLGDSITGGQVAPDDYPTIIANLTEMTVINMGFPGANMAYGGLGNFDVWAIAKAIYSNDYSAQVTDGRFADKVAILQALDWNTVDFVTIFAGTNDWNAPVTLDQGASVYNDNDRYSFSTSLRYVINRLLTKYPHLKILPVTVMWRARKTLGDGWDVDTTANSNNNYLRDFATKAQDVAKEFHLPCLDLYNTCGFNKLNHSLYLSDGLHPTVDKGIPVIGNKIAEKLMLEFC